MGEDLSDGILVGGVEGGALAAFLSTLVKTFELIHGTVGEESSTHCHYCGSMYNGIFVFCTNPDVYYMMLLSSLVSTNGC